MIQKKTVTSGTLFSITRARVVVAVVMPTRIRGADCREPDCRCCAAGSPRRTGRWRRTGPDRFVGDYRSEQADDVAVRVEVDPLGVRVGRQAGHGAHVAADGVDV